MSTVYGCSAFNWKFIFLLLQVLHLSLFIAVLNTQFWFLQKWEMKGSYYYDDNDDYKQVVQNYRGGLLVSRKYYVNYYNDFFPCSDESTYEYCYKSCRDKCNHDEDDSEYAPWLDESNCNEFCTRYQVWHIAGVIYLTFQILALFFTILITIFIFLTFFNHRSLKKRINLNTTSKMMIFVFIFNLIGFSSYAGIVKLNFDSCKHRLYYEGGKSVCAGEGAIFALIILLWLGIIVPLYVIVARKIEHKEKQKASTEQKPESIEMSS
jgi:hypothetical protein